MGVNGVAFGCEHGNENGCEKGTEHCIWRIQGRRHEEIAHLLIEKITRARDNGWKVRYTFAFGCAC